MPKVYDVVTARRYTDRNGEEKTAYTNIGAVFEKNGKLSMKLSTAPIGWDGWAQLYVPKPKDGTSNQSVSNKNEVQTDQFEDDEIPF